MLCDKCKLEKEVIIGAYSKSKGFKQYCGDCFKFRDTVFDEIEYTEVSPVVYEVNSVANRDQQGNEI